MNQPARILLLLWAIVANIGIQAQTQEEWARIVNWDGVSHWSKYIITQPKFMGPNALPVPYLTNGGTDSTNYVGSSASFHFTKGDRAQDLAVFGNYCLLRDRISIDISYEPVEIYQTSDTIKKQRHVYYKNYYDNHARGDVHLNFNIRIFRKWEKTVQLALRIGYRYPASSGLESARYTDGMGYYFDVSYGKPLSPNLKWIGMAGFYVWQLNGDGHRQNDAFLFGNGLEWNRNGWKAQGYIAGYMGYLYNSGDKPIVVRAQAEKRFKKSGLLFRMQHGIQDYMYTSAELGVKFYLNIKSVESVK
ncbi:MAG: hypothetical protein ACO25B_01005 [Chitinophagaceae bacterium]